jgi:hypothetical protein
MALEGRANTIADFKIPRSIILVGPAISGKDSVMVVSYPRDRGDGAEIILFAGDGDVMMARFAPSSLETTGSFVKTRPRFLLLFVFSGVEIATDIPEGSGGAGMLALSVLKS